MDRLFDAVAETIAAVMQHAFDAALTKDETPEQRVISALVAKHEVVRDRVRRSSFAPELFAIKNRANAARFKELDDGFVMQIATALVTAGYPDDQAKQLADVLFAASQGIANAAESTEQMRRQIGKLGLMISAEDGLD